MKFEYIFKKYLKAIIFFINRMIDSKPDAEDICSNVFMKLWQRFSNFETEQKVKAFLYISARNASVNFLKQRNSKRLKELKEDYDLKDTTAESLTDEFLLLIDETLSALTPCQREIITAVIFEGLTDKEAAIKFNKTEKTVRNQRHTAISIIKSKLHAT